MKVVASIEKFMKDYVIIINGSNFLRNKFFPFEMSKGFMLRGELSSNCNEVSMILKKIFKFSEQIYVLLRSLNFGT